MRKFIVASMLMVASLSFAEPTAVAGRSAKILLPDGSEQVVDGPGKWLNDEALMIVNHTIVDLEDQNTTLRQIVQNVQVAPGLPQWATVLISTCLAALTVIAGFFAVKEATK